MTDARPRLIEQWRARADERRPTGGYLHSERTVATLRQCADELAALDQPAAPSVPLNQEAIAERAAELYHSENGEHDRKGLCEQLAQAEAEIDRLAALDPPAAELPLPHKTFADMRRQYDAMERAIADAEAVANEAGFTDGAYLATVLHTLVNRVAAPSQQDDAHFDDWASHIVDTMARKSNTQLEYEIVEGLQKAYRLGLAASQQVAVDQTAPQEQTHETTSQSQAANEAATRGPQNGASAMAEDDRAVDRGDSTIAADHRRRSKDHRAVVDQSAPPVVPPPETRR